MRSSKISKPNILLIGAGRFGEQHLRVWHALMRSGRVILSGVVDGKRAVRGRVAARYGVPTYRKATPALLKEVDAVDIVTPPETHRTFARYCLRYTNVFLEKPIALSARDAFALAAFARRKRRMLVAGHIYRFNGAVLKLQELLRESPAPCLYADAAFLDTPARPTDECGILFSDLHAFDILDFLFEEDPATVSGIIRTVLPRRRFEDNAVAVLKYHSGFHAVVRLSWTAFPKTRVFILYFRDRTVVADLASQVIEIHTARGRSRIHCGQVRPLTRELTSFAEALHGGKIAYPDGVAGARIVNIAEQVRKSAEAGRPIRFRAFPEVL